METRIIKFRAWAFDEMHYMEEDGYVQIFSDGSGTVWSRFVEGEGCTKCVSVESGKFMQNTGLKDRLKKDIYEGDILAVHGQDGFFNVVCKFGTVQREMATGWLVDITGFYFERPDGLCSFPIVKNFEGKHDLENNMEVCGNVWEHPELIESKNK